MRNGRRLILHVDDDADFRFAVRQMLEASDFEVAEAATAEEGLQLFRDTEPDLILLDLMMEEIDAGVSLLRELRASGATVPVYLISSVGDTMTMTTDPTELGFSGVLQKPIEEATLLSVMHARLGVQAEPD